MAIWIRPNGDRVELSWGVPNECLYIIIRSTWTGKFPKDDGKSRDSNDLFVCLHQPFTHDPVPAGMWHTTWVINSSCYLCPYHVSLSTPSGEPNMPQCFGFVQYLVTDMKYLFKNMADRASSVSSIKHDTDKPGMTNDQGEYWRSPNNGMATCSKWLG